MALPDLCFSLSISWCYLCDTFIANHSDANIWGRSKALVLFDVNVWNGSSCYSSCFLFIHPKSLVLAIVTVVILVFPPPSGTCGWCEVPRGGWREGICQGCSWGWFWFVRLFSPAVESMEEPVVCVCRGTLCAWEARLDWAHLQSLCFQGLQPLYVPTLLTEEVLNFSPISLESLARPLSDIQQNSNYTFSESGIQVYLENSPQNVGDLFTRHSLAGCIIEICPLWLCLCLEELVGQRRLLCLGKLLLVCHHPLWFLKSCRHWFMQLLEQTWPPLWRCVVDSATTCR